MHVELTILLWNGHFYRSVIVSHAGFGVYKKECRGFPLHKDFFFIISLNMFWPR
jgi:hypothetical protein